MSNTMIEDAVDAELAEKLTDLLAEARRGAATRPVSVTLPAPLADAFRLLADQGMIENVSVATARALEEVLQAAVMGAYLDEIYEKHPEVRPTDEQIREMARRGGLE